MATRQDTTRSPRSGHKRATKFKCDFDAIAAFQYAAFGMDATDGRDGFDGSRRPDSNWIWSSQMTGAPSSINASKECAGRRGGDDEAAGF